MEITPQLVQAAYAATQLRRAWQRWGSTATGDACPIAAVCLAFEQGHPGDVGSDAPAGYSADRLGIDRLYVIGFVHAYDGRDREQGYGRAYDDGYAAGLAVWAADWPTIMREATF